MRKYTIYTPILMLLLLCFSCANSYKISTKDSLNFSDYTIYAFQLCEKIEAIGNERYFLCDSLPTSINKTNTQVVEELYLLISKTSNRVIYLTTKTDRSFKVHAEIFNTENHKNYILANDIENVYFGELINETFIFTNKNETLKFYSQQIDSTIVLTALLSKIKEKTTINNRTVYTKDLYSTAMQFKQTNRKLAIAFNKKKNIDLVTSMVLTGNKILLKGTANTIKRAQKRRLKYHPQFENAREKAF